MLEDNDIDPSFVTDFETFEPQFYVNTEHEFKNTKVSSGTQKQNHNISTASQASSTAECHQTRQDTDVVNTPGTTRANDRLSSCDDPNQATKTMTENQLHDLGLSQWFNGWTTNFNHDVPIDFGMDSSLSSSYSSSKFFPGDVHSVTNSTYQSSENISSLFGNSSSFPDPSSRTQDDIYSDTINPKSLWVSTPDLYSMSMESSSTVTLPTNPMHTFTNNSTHGALSATNLNSNRSKASTQPPTQPARPRRPQRPFVCSTNGCTRSYNRRYELQRHQLKHSGVKDYSCRITICDRSGNNGFARKDHLKQHLRYVHGVIN